MAYGLNPLDLVRPAGGGKPRKVEATLESPVGRFNPTPVTKSEVGRDEKRSCGIQSCEWKD